MPKQRHIGYTIFAICSALVIRSQKFEPKPHVLTPAEERWGTHPVEDEDRFGTILHGVRIYICGIGIIGLLMVVEDYFSERSRKPVPPKAKEEENKLNTRG